MFTIGKVSLYPEFGQHRITQKPPWCSFSLHSKTIAVLLAETNAFATFENQGQLVSYSGYDIVENQSGQRSGKTRMSKKGNAHIRRAMHMPALGVVRNQETPFVSVYDRLIGRGKTKMWLFRENYSF